MDSWKKTIAMRLRASRTPQPDDGVIDELAQHLEDRYSELMSSGLDAGAARSAVLAELDGVDALAALLPSSKREHIERSPAAGAPDSGHLLSGFGRDLLFGWRMLRKSPLFTLFAVVCLGVGIGATTTVFTIVNTLLLHPLPAKNPSRLVVLYDAPATQAKQPWSRPALSYANLQDYLQHQQCFRSAAGYTGPQVLTLAGKNGPEQMFGEFVTRRYFSTLGLSPALGRFFVPAEDTAPGSAPVAVLSYAAWQARFNGSRDVLGARSS